MSCKLDGTALLPNLTVEYVCKISVCIECFYSFSSDTQNLCDRPHCYRELDVTVGCVHCTVTTTATCRPESWYICSDCVNRFNHRGNVAQSRTEIFSGKRSRSEPTSSCSRRRARAGDKAVGKTTAMSDGRGAPGYGDRPRPSGGVHTIVWRQWSELRFDLESTAVRLSFERSRIVVVTTALVVCCCNACCRRPRDVAIRCSNAKLWTIIECFMRIWNVLSVR